MKLEEFRAVIRNIPRGKVMTYAEVALEAGYPTGARQVVWALKACGPDVPWHRVVGKGYQVRLSGSPGLEQIMRLESEGWRVRGRKLIRPDASADSGGARRRSVSRASSTAKRKSGS